VHTRMLVPSRERTVVPGRWARRTSGQPGTRRAPAAEIGERRRSGRKETGMTVNGYIRLPGEGESY
jgi:hypothetical protein